MFSLTLFNASLMFLARVTTDVTLTVTLVRFYSSTPGGAITILTV